MFLLTLPALSWSQGLLGNEWINYNQQYFAVKVHEQGIYRVDYDVLMDAGMPLGTFDPRSFQVFCRGQEQPLFVKDESSGLFQPGDYLEFYAEKNDGWFDKGFYSNPAHQPNDHYSLVNDTATCYITWNSSLNNKRFLPETDASYENYPQADYFWHTVRQDYVGGYYAGETNNYGVTDPEYTATQGWFDGAFNVGQSKTKTLPTPFPFLTGPQATVEMAVAGASNYASLNRDHHLRIQFAGQVIDTIYEGYKLLNFSQPLEPASLNPSGTPFVFSSINDLESPVDRNAIIYVSIRYPRTFDFGNASELRMEIPASQGLKTKIVFTNFNLAAGDSAWIYDLTNHRRIPVAGDEAEYKAIVPEASLLRDCFITSSSAINTITQAQPVNKDPGSFARFQNFMAPAHFNADYLMITHGSLMPAARNYANYRTTTGYKVLLVDVDQLYHQFAYGINRHPLALRNFARFTLSHYDNPPTKLFLIGKAYNTRVYRRNSNYFANTLVPSFGDPASDILITAGLLEGLWMPAIATGRLAAKTPEDVSNYLEKIVQYEAARQQPQEWMKNVLHFGGGSSLAEQAVLAHYLQNYENIISDTLFGGYVRTFLKSSTEPIQVNQSDSLKDIIDNGVSLMTFFGHAAGIGFDISIDYPSEYNNYGKYPFLIANSCFAGDIFGTGQSSSEEFVLIQNKGTIGYMASTSASGSFELNRYTNAFLRNLSGSKYGQPVGDNIQQVIRTIESTNRYIKNICLLNVLHADPALVINYQPKPDYQITPREIFFDPAEVTTEIDTFAVHVVSTNIGKAVYDSVMVELIRVFPDNSTQRELERIPGTLFKDTLTFRMPLNIEKGIGLNQFQVTLNAYNEVEEMSLTNNMASNSLLIRPADVLPVYPPDYAIVPDAQVTLMASTGEPFLPDRSYVFELDTNASFSHPLRHTVIQQGGVISWTPSVALADSTVYFWRVSRDSIYNGSYSWRSSSFQYIPDRRGWSQAHFDQFAGNKYQYVHHNPENRQWEFVNNFLSIQAQTGIYPYIPWNEVWLKVNGSVEKIWSCMTDRGNAIIFNVFDPISGEVWKSENQGDGVGTYGNYHCSTNPLTGFDFYSSDETWRDRARAFLDTIPQGHYVMAWNHRNHYAENYSEELYQAFESIGSANIRNLVNNTPYLIYGRKGAPIGTANEVIGGSITSIIQLTDSLRTNWNKGYILSEKIGPASEWQSLHWQQQAFEALNTDSVWLQVLGVQRNGAVDTLLSYIPAGQYDLDLSAQIDAQVYPFIQLKVNMLDELQRTPAQMERWQVIYEGVPEIALDPESHFHFIADTLAEGQPLEFSTAIRNISRYPTDSLLVHYWILDENQNRHPIEYSRKGPLQPGQVLIDTISIATHGMSGSSSLWIEANPDDDQPEQHHFNNMGRMPFVVQPDQSNPLLDVTFDGIRILDGDIVSPEATIKIILKDENQFYPLNDTTRVQLFLQGPSQSAPRQVFFRQDGQDQMHFFPATLPENTCMVEFNPDLSQDGIYRLNVQATDGSENESGDEEYSIHFEVVNKSTITEVLNWPNPFSTRTHFVFTLTGSRLPTFFRIQIMTITGKVVREIDLPELGPITIGRNVTTYAWDGTDQYGDRLANGVYLYRVITNIDDEEIERNVTEAARFFHKEFGKMYLMR